MGVATVKDIDYGQIFGPFPKHLTVTDPTYIIGMLTCDKPPDGVIIQVDTDERLEGMKVVDWLPYVSPARDEEEQNMEAYLKDGGVFYRTLRIVKAGEELLVWYSKDFTKILGIPELQNKFKRDDEQYICTHCGEMFDFPYPLRAHLKFKCSFSAADTSGVISDHEKHNKQRLSCSENVTNNKYTDRLQEKSHCVLNYMTNNNAMFTISSKRHLNEEPECKTQTKKFISENGKPRKEITLSHSIEELVGKSAGKRLSENGIDSYSETGSAFRKVEKLQRLSPDTESSPTSLSSFVSISKTLSPPIKNSSPQSVITRPSMTALPGTHGFPFHKVHQPPLISPSSLREHTSSMPPPPSPSVNSLTSPATSVRRPDSALSGPAIMGLYMPRIPLISSPSSLGMSGRNIFSAGSSGARGISVPHSAYSDQIPPGLLELCRATIPTIGPLTESFAANIRNSETLAKQALFAERHISTLSFLKSTNPMVEKLLHSTNPTILTSPINALNLSQNWCAKCNATFRMTSDLVYHMRSHHKREFDPMKRKREEKLKCNICNETFRERHHLTRHMSSHA